MATAPSLYTVLASLRGGGDGDGGEPADPAAALAAAGHADLPGELLAEAIVSYADTAAVEVAEHLAPFVTAHTGGTADAVDPAAYGLGLLATAPPPPAELLPAELVPEDSVPTESLPAGTGTAEPPADVPELAFGAGELAGDPGEAAGGEGPLADAFGAGAAPPVADPAAGRTDLGPADPDFTDLGVAGPAVTDPTAGDPEWGSADPMDLFAVPPDGTGGEAAVTEPAPDDEDDLFGG